LRDAADLALGPIAFGQGNDLARYVGTIGDLDFWVYNDRYVDDNDVVQKLLPDYTVLVGSPTSLKARVATVLFRMKKQAIGRSASSRSRGWRKTLPCAGCCCNRRR
jgi:hypothetical protein